MLPIVPLDVSIISPDSAGGSNKSSIIADVGTLKSKNGSESFMSAIMSLDVSIMSAGSLLLKRSSSM